MKFFEATFLKSFSVFIISKPIGLQKVKKIKNKLPEEKNESVKCKQTVFFILVFWKLDFFKKIIMKLEKKCNSVYLILTRLHILDFLKNFAFENPTTGTKTSTTKKTRGSKWNRW